MKYYGLSVNGDLYKNCIECSVIGIFKRYMALKQYNKNLNIGYVEFDIKNIRDISKEEIEKKIKEMGD